MLIDGADCKALSFDFEPYLAEKLDFCLDPSARPRKAEICKFFLRGTCQRGNSCPMNHGKSDKALLCKHWLRGLCKKGDLCEYLHEYNLKKMPECWFFSNAYFYISIPPQSKKNACGILGDFANMVLLVAISI
ncbi:RNA-binding component of cleavage and polyadenylation factor [Mitosporidium daphniae]